MIFTNRQDAGRKLSDLLLPYQNKKDAIVIGLPRGGVVPAFEIAKILHLPLDIICARKLGAPLNPELAIGAITEKGHLFLNLRLIRELGISETFLQQEMEKERQLALERFLFFRKEKPPRDLKEKLVILVDDGLATGATMKAAIQTAKEEKAKKILVAIPVSPPETLLEISPLVDEIFCLSHPQFFEGLSQFYDDFPQVDDSEVLRILSSKTL